MPVIPKADIIEIFSSIQGEGLLVGYRQIFLRFPECNLNCRYCDTDFKRTMSCQVEKNPGTARMANWDNPIELEQVLKLLASGEKQLPGAHHSISITGGEPLLHEQLLSAWLPELSEILPIHLETNGTLPDQLERLIDDLDWVAMDIKLHSQTGERTDWETHRRFLDIARVTNCYVKLVIGEETPDLELQLAADLVNSVERAIPIILQPVTLKDRVALPTERLLQMQGVISELHHDVRVIPQTHRFMGVL
jgi:7-carboxy-7-deazaguanine synthase